MAADLQVGPQTTAKEFGILIYDIPEEHMALWRRIQSRVRRRAIRLNLSVYLFLWSMKEDLEKIVEDAKAECPGQIATVFIAKFDNGSKDELNIKAKECLIRDIREIGERLLDTVVREQEKARENGTEFKHVREQYLLEIKKRLEEAQALAMLFGLTHDIKHAMESTQRVFAGELTKLLAERQVSTASRKATKSKRDALKVFAESLSNSA